MLRECNFKCVRKFVGTLDILQAAINTTESFIRATARWFCQVTLELNVCPRTFLRKSILNCDVLSSNSYTTQMSFIFLTSENMRHEIDNQGDQPLVAKYIFISRRGVN